MTMTRIELTVNGTAVSLTVGAHQPLLDVLRDELSSPGRRNAARWASAARAR